MTFSFNIVIDYNYEGGYWVDQLGKRVENMQWRQTIDSFYPVLDNQLKLVIIE